MAAVVLVSRDVDWALRLAEGWRSDDVATHLVLLDAAAAVARTTHPLGAALRVVVDRGAVVSAHDEALARRGMTPADVADGIKTVTIDEIADLVGNARGEVMWL